LPKLPHYQVNAYVTDGPNQDIANVFLRLIQTMLSKESVSEFSDTVVKFA